MAELVGKTIGQYQIVEEIGRGGMAIVYKAWQPAAKRYVALKILPPQLAFDSTLVRRFQEEARAASRLKHPNVVRIYDVGEADGTHYMAMEYLEGQDLGKLIAREGALALDRVVKIVKQIASALDHAHSHDYIHRDIKPSNILIGADDRVTLTDFGIVKAAAGTRLTRTGTLIGTPQYMSLEQARGQEVDHRTDVYSLGVVCYEMLAGRVPFGGETPAILHAHAYETPPPLLHWNPSLSPQVEAVVLRALAKEKERRYARAGELAEALERASSERVEAEVKPEERPTVLELRGEEIVAVPGTRPWRPPAWLIVALVAVMAFFLIPRLPQGGEETPATVTSAGTPTPLGLVLTPMATPTRRADAVVNNPGVELNLRQGPGTQYEVIVRMPHGEELEIVGRNPEAPDWLQVRRADGQVGWASTTLMTVHRTLDDVPVVAIAITTPTPAGINPTFRADRLLIAPGDCTTLRWDVDGIRAVYLDGRGQPGHGSERVCLARTQTFTLEVVQRDGRRTSWPLTIEVSSSITPPPQRMFDIKYHGCIGHNLQLGCVKGQVFNRQGRVIVGALVEIAVDGQRWDSPANPARTNEAGWYEWNLTPGQRITFLSRTVDGQRVSFYPAGYEVKSKSGCFQHVDFWER